MSRIIATLTPDELWELSSELMLAESEKVRHALYDLITGFIDGTDDDAIAPRTFGAYIDVFPDNDVWKHCRLYCDFLDCFTDDQLERTKNYLSDSLFGPPDYEKNIRKIYIDNRYLLVKDIMLTEPTEVRRILYDLLSDYLADKSICSFSEFFSNFPDSDILRHCGLYCDFLDGFTLDRIYSIKEYLSRSLSNASEPPQSR